ncbi:MAG: DUF3429 domain-containing protein [Caulobacterales bacterium]|jgi:hypothetical protein
MPTPIPFSALWLGLAGLIPFYGAGFAMLARDPNVTAFAATAFAIYATAILSFLGGARWGLEIARAPAAPDPRRLVFSVLPSLAGWAAAVAMITDPQAPWSAGIFAGLFAAQYVWDRQAARDAAAPDWYPPLREVLTGGVIVACLALPIARFVTGG